MEKIIKYENNGGCLRCKFIMLLFCFIFFCCNNKDYPIDDYDKSLLDEFNTFFDLNNDYKEYYRLYCFMGRKHPYVLTIFNENNIWYLSYDWYELKNEPVLFVVDVEFILHNSIYKIEDEDIINFQKITKKLNKMKNYDDYNTEFVNKYYFDYNNDIIKTVNNRNIFHNSFKKIIIFYNNLLEKYKNK